MINSRSNTKRRIFLISLIAIALFVINWSELFIQRNQHTIGYGISRPFLFILINVHVIAIIILLYLIIRQSIKLFTERTKQRPGSAFKKNLFFSFALFSVIPSFFIFFSAGKFITTSIDDWFHARINNGLSSGFALHKVQTQHQRQYLAQLGTKLYNYIINTKPQTPPRNQLYKELSKLIPQDGKFHLYLWPTNTKLLHAATKHEVSIWRNFRKLNDRTTKSLRTSLQDKLKNITKQTIFDFYGSLYWAKAYNDFLIVLVYRYPEHIRIPLIEIQNSLHDYQHLKSIRNQIYTNYMYTFFLITLLILFLSVWCAFYLSRGISKPIQNLIQATQRLKQGKLDTSVTLHPNSDLKALENGFNEMSRALQQMHHKIARKNKEMLAILENIKASVFFVNTFGRIITYNKAAKDLTKKYLGVTRFKNKRINFFGKQVTTIFFKLIRKLYISKQECLSEALSLSINNEPKDLMIHITIISSQKAFNYAEKKGILVVVEDLTNVVKANKIKTWREAAKQMAHEIKNPLTPIQLATQRLQRKYKNILHEEPVFRHCTDTILKQVSIVKNLTSHFSEFASMPALKLTHLNINKTIEDVMRFYTISYPNISFFYALEPGISSFTSDPHKIKRILINLMDNSVRALSNQKQKEKIIKVSTSYDNTSKSIKILITDNGPGIDKSVKNKLFLPYVSSNKKNMGLGLAIVHDAIQQLKGSIKLLPTRQGASFKILIPTKHIL